MGIWRGGVKAWCWGCVGVASVLLCCEGSGEDGGWNGCRAWLGG